MTRTWKHQVIHLRVLLCTMILKFSLWFQRLIAHKWRLEFLKQWQSYNFFILASFVLQKLFFLCKSRIYYFRWSISWWEFFLRLTGVEHNITHRAAVTFVAKFWFHVHGKSGHTCFAIPVCMAFSVLQSIAATWEHVSPSLKMQKINYIVTL